MNINDFLMKYRLPLFDAEGAGGGGGGAAPAAPAAPVGDAAPAGGEGAPEGEAPAGGDKTLLGGEGEKPVAPEGEDTKGEGGDDPADAGEFKLSAPEGMEDFQGEFDTFSSEASAWMQENPEATPGDALKWAAARQAEAVSKQSSEMSEAFTKQIETWENEARADKEIGGDAFDANLAQAKAALDAFGNDELKAALVSSGLGSHPAMIKFAVNAGKTLSDAPVIKTNGGEAKKSLAASLYPDK